MRNIARMAAVLVPVTGLILLVLGLLFWFGRAQTLIPLHMVVGFLFVLSTWIIAGVGLRAGAGAMAAFTFVWGVVVIALGMTQAQLFPGPYHWIVRVAHLAVGVVAMALAGRLTRQIRDWWGTERKSPIPGTGNIHPTLEP